MNNVRAGNEFPAELILWFVGGMILLALAIESGILWVAIPVSLIVFVGTLYVKGELSIASRVAGAVLISIALFGALTVLFPGWYVSLPKFIFGLIF